MNKNKRVSIVIPVYNEEEYLSACLDAIAGQTVRPYEVIVVDNNSTDNSVAVATRYPFVRIIYEKSQGVVYARDAGFDQTKGGIIGRIDADTLLAPTWVEAVQRIFDDPTVDAVSGSITYRDIMFTEFFRRAELFFRQWVANGLKKDGFLYGSNMAMRRSAWQAARESTCNSRGLHEDIDLGIHASAAAQRVVFDKDLHVAVHLRRFDTTFYDFLQWAWLTPRTYTQHGIYSQWRIACVAALATLFYWPIKFLHKGYNAENRSFSWQKLFAPVTQRVNPATFVD